MFDKLLVLAILSQIDEAFNKIEPLSGDRLVKGHRL